MKLLIDIVNHAIKNLAYKKEYKQEMKKWLKERVENLIDYSTLDRNI